jgi:hypothetical protein
MVIHIVRFRSALSEQRITELFRVRAPEYLDIPGLLQNHYSASAVVSTAASTCGTPPRQWSGSMQGDLARSICDAYRVEESVRDVAEVAHLLRDENLIASST